MSHARILVVVAGLSIASAFMPAAPARTTPASPVASAPTGTLVYRILGPDGGPVPARLTVLSPSVDLVESDAGGPTER